MKKTNTTLDCGEYGYSVIPRTCFWTGWSINQLYFHSNNYQIIDNVTCYVCSIHLAFMTAVPEFWYVMIKSMHVLLYVDTHVYKQIYCTHTPYIPQLVKLINLHNQWIQTF